MKHIHRYLPLLCLTALIAPMARAQSSFDVELGGGTVHSKSTTVDFGSIGTFRSGSLGGFFLGFGGNLMLFKHLGFGIEAKLQPHKPDYATIFKARTTLWDFNAIYQPVVTKKVDVQLQGGLGGANIRLYDNSSACTQFCSGSSQFLVSSNHFQLHAGVGIQVFLTEHIYVKPQLDAHYIPKFNEYGSNFVPSAMVWVGYSFGDR